MFQTERLLLRPRVESLDLELMWKASNDIEYRIMLGAGPLLPWTKDDVKKIFFSAEGVYNPALPVLAICLKPDGDGEAAGDKSALELPSIGHISLLSPRYDAKNRVAMIGVGIMDVQHRAKGYGREAINFMLEYGFMELNVHRIELQVFSFNTKAIGLYRSIGFIDEGVARKTYFKSGTWHDTVHMAILEEEWWEIRKTNKVRVMPAHLQ